MGFFLDQRITANFMMAFPCAFWHSTSLTPCFPHHIAQHQNPAFSAPSSIPSTCRLLNPTPSVMQTNLCPNSSKAHLSSVHFSSQTGLFPSLTGTVGSSTFKKKSPQPMVGDCMGLKELQSNTCKIH